MTGLQLKYFVLNPTKDDAYGEASRKALLAYADAIQDENHELAYDVRHWVLSCRHQIRERAILSAAKTDTQEPSDGEE